MASHHPIGLEGIRSGAASIMVRRKYAKNMLARAAATPAPKTTIASATLGAFSVSGRRLTKLERSNSAATPFNITRNATARLA
jgi:hypothetical protein